MEKQEKLFKKLKKRFTKELVLAAPDLDKKMRMEVNTSQNISLKQRETMRFIIRRYW